ncbi:MAG: hypothetical protein FRX48_01807 [Lasallia pustulata]|uniref:Uncharacterized protein n=1 Tax=Lasallia pustulata TaxID=136370 RepID=A0A5M8Q281_9LECA|nr:MAG: hypothetical protein FRX48_01807 [Lasallia pustulata]
MSEYDRTATFLYPPDNQRPFPAYASNDSVNVAWTSDFPASGTGLRMWCTNNASQSTYDIAMNPVQAPPNATLADPFPVHLGQALSSDLTVLFCHFELAIVDSSHPYGRFDNADKANSGSFNIFNNQDNQPFTWALTVTSSSTSLLTATSATMSTSSLTSSTAIIPNMSTISAAVSPTSVPSIASGNSTSSPPISSTDLVHTTASPTTPSSNIYTAASPKSSSSTNPDSPQSGGLSTRAKAGIAKIATQQGSCSQTGYFEQERRFKSLQQAEDE